MNQREKTLSLLVGGTLALMVPYFGWTWYQDALDARAMKLAAETQRLNDLQLKQRYVDRAAAIQREWKERSLPDDRELSLNQYQAWLARIGNEKKLANLALTPSVGEKKGVYKRFEFNLTGQGTIERIGEFLEEFEKIDRLQSIRNLVLTPNKAGTLDVSMTIEALALPGVKAAQLPETPNPDTAYREAAGVVAKRNFFAEYVPPPPPIAKVEPIKPPPPPPPTPRFDQGTVTYVTAFIENNGVPEVWLTLRTQGKKLELREGDTFDLDGQKGEVVKIQIPEQRVEIKLGEKTVVVQNGKPLSDGKSSGGDRGGRFGRRGE